MNSFGLLGDWNTEWYFYNDEESLRLVLTQIVDITLKKALGWMEENGKPSFNIYEFKFDESFLQEVGEFIQTNKLDVNNPGTISELQGILKRDRSDLIIRYTSYIYGEIFINQVKGEWENCQGQFPIVSNLGGYKNFKIQPFYEVCTFLEAPENNNLIHFYKIKSATALS